MSAFSSAIVSNFHWVRDPEYSLWFSTIWNDTPAGIVWYWSSQYAPLGILYARTTTFCHKMTSPFSVLATLTTLFSSYQLYDIFITRLGKRNLLDQIVLYVDWFSSDAADCERTLALYQFVNLSIYFNQTTTNAPVLSIGKVSLYREPQELHSGTPNVHLWRGVISTSRASFLSCEFDVSSRTPIDIRNRFLCSRIWAGSTSILSLLILPRDNNSISWKESPYSSALLGATCCM